MQATYLRRKLKQREKILKTVNSFFVRHELDGEVALSWLWRTVKEKKIIEWKLEIL